MPLYEYEYVEPGKPPVVIELLRSPKDADAPVPDPEGLGRVFKRKFSVFASGGSAGGSTGTGHVHSGTCGCGRRPGSCGAG